MGAWIRPPSWQAERGRQPDFIIPASGFALPGPLGKSGSIFERPIFMDGKKIIEKMKNGLDKRVVILLFR